MSESRISFHPGATVLAFVLTLLGGLCIRMNEKFARATERQWAIEVKQEEIIAKLDLLLAQSCDRGVMSDVRP